MTDPRDDERGGEQRDSLARYRMLNGLFLRDLSDVDIAYRRRLVTDLAGWFETRPETPDQEASLVSRAYEIVADAEEAYPGDMLWDSLRALVATDLLQAGSAEAAGLILSTCPDAKRAVELIAAITDSCMEHDREDLLPEIDIAYGEMLELFTTADPDFGRLTHRYMRNHFIATYPELLDEPYVAFDTELAIGHDDYDPVADWAEIAAEDMPAANWAGLVQLIRNDEVWSADTPPLLRQHLCLLLAYMQQAFSERSEITVDDVDDLDENVLLNLRPALSDDRQLGRLRGIMAGFLRQNGHEIAADHMARER